MALRLSGRAWGRLAALLAAFAVPAAAVCDGRMEPGEAAALVGAGMLSVLVFPLVGLRLRAGSRPAEGGPGQERRAERVRGGGSW